MLVEVAPIELVEPLLVDRDDPKEAHKHCSQQQPQQQLKFERQTINN